VPLVNILEEDDGLVLAQMPKQAPEVRRAGAENQFVRREEFIPSSKSNISVLFIFTQLLSTKEENVVVVIPF